MSNDIEQDGIDKEIEKIRNMSKVEFEIYQALEKRMYGEKIYEIHNPDMEESQRKFDKAIYERENRERRRIMNLENKNLYLKIWLVFFIIISIILFILYIVQALSF